MKILILVNQQKLVSQIDEVPAVDIGEPDCKLVEPFVINKDETLYPWLCECTSQNTLYYKATKNKKMI